MNVHFPNKLCINLDLRPDRWRRFKTRMNKFGLDNITRFPAINGNQEVLPAEWRHTSGAYGCLQSHLKIVCDANENNWPHVLILEDDVVLHPEFNDLFSEYLKEVPDDWDLLYLGGIHDHEPAPVTEHVVRLKRTYCTFAYALHRRAYPDFININSREFCPVDVNNFQLQTTHNCYGFHPPLAWVEEDFSDIAEKHTNHWWMRYGFAMRGLEIGDLLNETLLIFNCKKTDVRCRYLIQHYGAMLPGVEIAVAGQRDSIESIVKKCRQKYKRYCFMPSHIAIWNWEFRACLFLGQKYDFVIPYESVVDLDNQDIESLMADNTYPDINRYQTRPGRSPQEHCLFLTLEGLENWMHYGDRSGLTGPSVPPGKHKVFKAPGTALCLG